MPKGQIPWNKGKSTDYMVNKWADPEWAEQQAQKISKGLQEKKARGEQPSGYAHGKYSGKNHWNAGRPAHNRKEHILRECLAEGCTNVIDKPPSLARIKFCSISCGVKTVKKRQLRLDWPHTGDPYGNDWVQLRDSILERDGNKCVLACDKPGKRLEVHHLCYDATCRDESHVVTLCSKCHQGGHRKELWPIRLRPAS